MATFWQGNWARSPQQQSGLQQISQSDPNLKNQALTQQERRSRHRSSRTNSRKKQKTPTRSRHIHVRVTVTIHFLRICLESKLVFTQIHENAKIVYTVLWFRSIKGTLSIAIRLYKSCSLPYFQYLCVWKIFCNNTLQKLVTLAILWNNKSPPRQNPRKKKKKNRKEEQERKTRSQERSTRKKNKKPRKKHRTTYNTKQNLTTKNNTYRLQR